MDADVIVVGAGLAGLVAAAELADAGRKVLLLEQEGPQSLGGQAFWSFGGLLLIDSPEQRRLRIKDSAELAWQDWLGTAGFDRDEDAWPRRWAEAYVEFAAGEKRAWLRAMGHRFFPLVQWAERGGSTATGHGNSVPRFHITWGTGPGVVEPFERRVRAAAARGVLEFRFRHQVDELSLTGGAVTGVRGTVLEPSRVPRGEASSRRPAGEFEFSAQAVIVTAGGIGGNHELVRKAWPARLGTPPETMISGVPAHVDGRMMQITQTAGGNIINADRMWHYVEGIQNWNPIWPKHGIRILSGPSPLWLDATGRRLPPPLFPGFDTLATLAHLRATGHDHSWFLLNQKIIEKEFTLSGSEQNPDLTGRSWRGVLARAGSGAPAPIQAFLDRGKDFITAGGLPELVAGMNALIGPVAPGGAHLLDLATVEREVRARDNEVGNRYSKDAQITAIQGTRNFIGDRLVRVVAPHRLLDPAAGPLIAVRLSVLTRKTLGGLETDLDGRVLGVNGAPIDGLYAAGESSGFGGGGMHGYRALEGTFLGGCLFSGRTAGRAAARATA
jgi:predicted oxidoreductase